MLESASDMTYAVINVFGSEGLASTQTSLPVKAPELSCLARVAMLLLPFASVWSVHLVALPVLFCRKT